MFQAGLVTTILVLLGTAGCMRRDGRNSDCRWPGEAGSGAASASHLSADAEFAEDLAIRFADTHYGLRTRKAGEGYIIERDRCMAALFDEVAKTHGVTAGDVARSLGKNRWYVDLAVILPYIMFYCFAVAITARMIWHRYPLAEGWVAGGVMMLFLSLVFAGGGTLLAELWCSLVETWRVGNGHMSYRGERLWWSGYRGDTFVCAWIVFLAVAAGQWWWVSLGNAERLTGSVDGLGSPSRRR